MARPMLALALVITLATANGQGIDDPLLDLPVEPPAPVNSTIAALFTQTNVRYPFPRKPGDQPTVPPPVAPPGDDQDDPRDEPPPVFFGEEIDIESGSIVYVLDYSGSMSYHDRIGTLKQEFQRSVQALSPNIRFSVICYACSIQCWSRTLLPATDENKISAIAYVKRLNPWGGTGTGPATAAGLLLDHSNLSVVLLTDGEPNCGANSLDDHRRMIYNANKQGAQITVFGIDAFGDYRAFCMNVAADSGGSYFDLSTPEPGNGRK